MYVRDTLCRRILFPHSRLALMPVLESSTDRTMQSMKHAGRNLSLHSDHFTQILCHTSPTITTRIASNPFMLNATVSQPRFRRTSLWVPQEITHYLKILKNHEKFPISLERWPKLCTAIVLYLSHFRSLPTSSSLSGLQAFSQEGVPQEMEVIQVFFHGKVGKHCCIPQRMAHAYEKSRTGYIYGTLWNTHHLSVDLISPLTSGIRMPTDVKFYLITKDTK